MTRLAVLADVHGNLHALEAVLARMEEERVDDVVCLGDLVGYGPLPNECVRRVKETGARCVAGNHDLVAVGRLPGARLGELARETLSWTESVLAEDCRRFLERLPEVAGADGMVLAHGSPDDPQAYVATAGAAERELDRAGRRFPGTRLLLVGHTHVPLVHVRGRGVALRGRAGEMTWDPDQVVLVNPGSVGQSRLRSPHARAAVIDLAARRVSLLAVPYDTAGCRRALRQRGLPEDAFHMPPRRGAIITRARRALSRLIRSG